MNRKPYIYGIEDKNKHYYRPANIYTTREIVHLEHNNIINLMLKIMEIIEIHGQKEEINRAKAAKFERVEAFAALNHNWTEKNIPYHHKPIMAKDGRIERKKSKSGIDCLECKHNYDPWQAVCPRCAALAEKKYKRIEAENKNMKSFINLIIGE